MHRRDAAFESYCTSIEVILHNEEHNVVGDDHGGFNTSVALDRSINMTHK